MPKHMMTSPLIRSNKSTSNQTAARASGLKALFLLSLLAGIGLFHIITYTINVTNRVPNVPIIRWRAKGSSPPSSSSDQHPAELTGLGSWLLNIPTFKYRRNNKLICRRAAPEDNEAQIILPVLIHTSRLHFVERQAIRRSWGSLQNSYRNFSVRLVFLLGEARSAGGDGLLNEFYLEQKLDEEHRLHKDLITGSFVDTYKNLTYKHMMGYKWILEHCPQAQLVLKADDDIFVDPTRFIDARLADIASSVHPPTNVYCCQKLQDKPARTRNVKWFVDSNEFGDETYPDYCSGLAYGITVDWIRKLYRMSRVTKYYWMDDVFTGMLTEMVKLGLREKPKISNICPWYDLVGSACRNVMYWRYWNAYWNEPGRFRAVVQLQRNEYFSEEMECLWNSSKLRGLTQL